MPAAPLNFFASHGRLWRGFHYVYPVISRRAQGLSIGINLNPDMACNFDCVYCQVDRSQEPRTRKTDLSVLESELRSLAGNYSALFEEPEFRAVPTGYRRLNDIAFSGDGEPTAAPQFPEAVRIAAAVRRDYSLQDAKIVVITDACFLTRPGVAAALAFLDENNGEIWAKLDAGTQDYFERINRARGGATLQHVLENILAAARVRPLVIQSLFLRLQGEAPTEDEITAYMERLRWIVQSGGQLALIQLYTVARRPAEAFAEALSRAELEQIALRVRASGLRAECYH
jgi:wyosine [tRNA(Phe)-imidazoG37] synthetase (radical SAM superfamily)